MRIAARLRGPIAFWALAGLALLVSHDAVFLAQMGPGERLTATLRTVGHDYWGAASVLLVAAAAIAASVTVARLTRLRRLAATIGAKRRARPTRLLPIWIRLAAVVVIGFALQENVEHFIAHGHLIGAGALVGPEYPLALPVLGLVSFVAALGAALLVASESALVAAIEEAQRRLRPVRATVRPPQRVVAPAGPILARFAAGRAPPAMLRLPS